MRSLLLASILFCFDGPAFAAPLDCGAVVKMHAFLSRAQFQCGFSRYSNEVIEQARSCSRRVGDRATKAGIKSGMQLFDERESEWGHDTICSRILADFPSTVRR